MNCTIVITTFFAGDKLEKCIKNLPTNIKKLIIDNGNETSNKEYFEKKFKNLIYYLSKTNLGVPASYSLANRLIETKYMFNTQPDVIVEPGCIEELLKKAELYKNAAILSPIIYHDKKYLLDGDYKVLKIKNGKFFKINKIFSNQTIYKRPEGDLCVDAVTGTAMLIDREKISKIGDWDTNIFNYTEDMDLCLRLRLRGYEIIKISSCSVNHYAFSSHEKKFHAQIDFSRNWHFAWSTIYFSKKHQNTLIAFIFGIRLMTISALKVCLYFLCNKKKFTTHFAKFLGYFNSITGQESWFRPNLK